MTNQLNKVGIFYEEKGDLKVYLAIIQQEHSQIVSGFVATDIDDAEYKAEGLGKVLYLNSVSSLLNSVAVAMAMTEMEKVARQSHEVDWDTIVDLTASQCQTCGVKVYMSDRYFGSPCGPYCERCMDQHFSECAHCSRIMGDETIVDVPDN
jgi:hypothetical protein